VAAKTIYASRIEQPEAARHMTTKTFGWLTIALCGVVLSGCGGGGGSSCEQTGTVEFLYSPAVRTNNNTQDALTYRLQQANTWTLQVRGVTQECLAGLNVRVPAGRDPLPAGVTLDANTGTIRTGVLTSNIEGYCSNSPSQPSVNRTCPAGAPYSDINYVLQISSDRINNTATPINTVITFQPAP
jgi:hypothetical protein